MIKFILLSVINVMTYALLAYVILSWLITARIGGQTVGRIYLSLAQLLEPILTPIRKIVPMFGTVELAPLIAFIVLRVLSSFINRPFMWRLLI